MRRKKKQKKITKEEAGEDLCFDCKDGGLLRICDYRGCNKSYHPGCIGKDDSFLQDKEDWKCGWHFCFICNKASKFHCYCCPMSVCALCISDAQFAVIRSGKGFCINCLELALLVENLEDADSKLENVNFEDRSTSEFLFKEYWEIISVKECLGSAELHSADSQMKKGRNFEVGPDADEVGSDGNEDFLMESDSDDKDGYGELKYLKRRKICSTLRSKEQKGLGKKVRKEYIGWGSKPLIDFLRFIGKDTNLKLSHHDVTSIVNEYIRKNKLVDPRKKKRVVCDARLMSVLGKKSFNKNKLYYLLEAHFAENLEESEEDMLENNSSEDKNSSLIPANHRVPNSTNKVITDISKGCYASIITENIKRVYLTRSVVQQLVEHPDTFESKVIGSFVRVKSDPNDYSQRNYHQLVQVTGVRNWPTTVDPHVEVLLQVTNVRGDFPISELSEGDFSEEECKDIDRRVKEGLLKRPTVEELHRKAERLHEDITRHWISRELKTLQNLIAQANEKGWRTRLQEHLSRRCLLEKPSEQSRLLQEVPKIIAELPDPEAPNEVIPGLLNASIIHQV